MNENDGKSDAIIRMQETLSLYLVLLKFRLPPINVVQEAPNILTHIPPHADSLLLFADIVKGYGNNDWRYDFVKTTLFRDFHREFPESLHYSKEYGVSLSSVLIPVLRRDKSMLELYLPTRYPRVLSIIIEDDIVTLDRLYKVEGLLRQETLWIRKRDDIAKLALIGTDPLNIKGTISEISARSGGYKAINLLVKIPIEYLSAELAFFASVSDYRKLVEELRILKRYGIGKKRDMGFGDLISWKIYKVLSNREVRVLDSTILYHKEQNHFKIITLRNLPATIINTLRQRGQLLIINMKLILSSIKPPYWTREGLYLMPFSEFLFKSN